MRGSGNRGAAWYCHMPAAEPRLFLRVVLRVGISDSPVAGIKTAWNQMQIDSNPPSAGDPPGRRKSFLAGRSHCIFVKVPAPDSAWQAPDTVEFMVRVLPSASVVPLKTMEPFVPLSPCNCKFVPDNVPATLTEWKQAECRNAAVPET